MLRWASLHALLGCSIASNRQRLLVLFDLDLEGLPLDLKVLPAEHLLVHGICLHLLLVILDLHFLLFGLELSGLSLFDL